MHSEREAEICELIDEATRQFVDALGLCARERLDIEELTTVLQAAFKGRNRMESAITGAIGALDRLTHPDPDSELTAGLHPAVWLADTLHISSSAAHAQLALARRLEAGHLAGTAEAFRRGEISGQHAGVVVRSVEMAVRGGCEPRHAEELMLQEAAQSDPRSALRPRPRPPHRPRGGGSGGAAAGRATLPAPQGVVLRRLRPGGPSDPAPVHRPGRRP